MHADSFIVTTAIEEKERHFVDTEDINRAFLHAEQKYFVVVKLMKKQANMLCDIDENYEQHVEHEGRNTTLCIMLSKSSYGTVAVAILWYETLTNALINDGFKLNPQFNPKSTKTKNL